MTQNPSDNTESLRSDTLSGARIYTKASLAIYDLYVLRFCTRFIWRCPKGRIVGLYNRNTAESRDHLDVGVGTGFFLSKTKFSQDTNIHLLDLNPNSLERTKNRLARYHTRTYEASALEEFPIEPASVDSVALSALLHCVPGDIRQKAAVLDHAERVLRPGGRLFGATVLAKDIELNPLARRLVKIYQSKKIFHNQEDSPADLERELTKRFRNVQVTRHGDLFLFEATSPA